MKNQVSDLRRPLREQAIRMEEQLKVNRIGWPAAFIGLAMVVSMCVAAVLIAWANSCGS